IVSINNINPVTNATYFVDNTGGTTIEYDGFTTNLEARASVKCGETYHIKLAISDAGDRDFNSAVFLEASSFTSTPVEVSIQTQTGDTTIVEGCANAEIFFIRPECDTANVLVVNYDIGGTAINGTDYTQIGTSITLQQGQDTVSIILEPLDDSQTDSPESIIITVYTVYPSGDTITSTGTIWIIESSPEVSVNDTVLPCLTANQMLLIATPVTGIQPYTFLWSNGATNDSILVPANTIGTFNYTVTMTDFCEEQASDVGTITVQEYNTASFTASPISGESPLVVNYDNTSSANATSYAWNFGNGQTQSTSTATNVSSTFTAVGNYITTLTVTNNQGCIDTSQALITVFELPEVSAPNVFTPNGDNNNDNFQFFDYKNINTFNCVITNRWGNFMYEMMNVTDKWNGLSASGKEADDGVYFYTYTGASLSGHEIKGHGFFHLIRD
ncbi:MAG: choice-of-anchor L domain-containing protein, partial [Crocinitomicaceae bacterium]|nr:choice-of-anchor L domain-containing protein [Crocinitomicaceae bacterium]